MNESWTIAANGALRNLSVTVTYGAARGTDGQRHPHHLHQVLTTMRNHRGFTLVELLVVLVIMGIVTGGIFKLLNTTQRLSRAQAERVDLQSNVRVASIVIPTELREMNAVIGAAPPDQNDILAMPVPGRASVPGHARHGLRLRRQPPPAQLRLRDWTGLRAPEATDVGLRVQRRRQDRDRLR